MYRERWTKRRRQREREREMDTDEVIEERGDMGGRKRPSGMERGREGEET